MTPGWYQQTLFRHRVDVPQSAKRHALSRERRRQHEIVATSLYSSGRDGDPPPDGRVAPAAILQRLEREERPSNQLSLGLYAEGNLAVLHGELQKLTKKTGMRLHADTKMYGEAVLRFRTGNGGGGGTALLGHCRREAVSSSRHGRSRRRHLTGGAVARLSPRSRRARPLVVFSLWPSPPNLLQTNPA